MYVTADASDEAVLAEAPGSHVHNIGGPSSVASTDVQKAGWIFTNTPDGRMRLTDYLDNVEKKIEAETTARKADVRAVRAQMDRNMAFNQAARSKLKKALLARMARNERKTKYDLHRAMRFVQARFAHAAAVQNARNNHNIAASKRIRARVAYEKKHAARQLHVATMASQKALATVKAAMNERIRQTDAAVHKNAAQIASNAKAATKALNSAVAMFDKKAAKAQAGAAAGRSKLQAQLAAQDKHTRAWANQRLKVEMMKTAAHFRRVEDQMAKDRAHADFALKSATTRFSASLNAAKALNTKRFAKTVRKINAARAEAKARVAKAKGEFNLKLRLLQATVKNQKAKTLARINSLSGVVAKHKLDQARVNANVNAEIKRMINIGQKRYDEHLKKDKELKSLVNSNRAANSKRLTAMAKAYTAELDAVQNTMKKNRAHASRRLAQETAKLYAAISKSEKAQMKVNGNLAKQTRRARMDVAQGLRQAKDDFSSRTAKLHTVILDNDRKFEKKLDKLTGIVRANAVKNQRGREAIASIQKANKEQLSAAVQAAIRKGEKRMQSAENKLVALNKKTKAALDLRIKTQISALRKRAEKQINGLRTQSKAARKLMKQQLMYAVKSMAKEAKKNLKAARKKSEAMFAKAEAQEAAAASKSAAGRLALAKRIAAEKKMAKRLLDGAVSTMERSLLALKTATRKKIKKGRQHVTDYANQIAKEAKDVNILMKNQLAKLNGKIGSMRSKHLSAISSANKASAAGFKGVNNEIARAMAKAHKKSKAKFSKLFKAMAKQRKDLDKKLQASTGRLNRAIAAQAALEDVRFRKTVKNINKARAAATRNVKAARSYFGTQIIAATTKINQQETRLASEIAVVSGMQTKNRQQQEQVNRRVNKEMDAIRKTANYRYSTSKRARGKLKRLMDENKKAAHEEVQMLNKLFTNKLNKVRAKANSDARAAGNDLKKKTKALYGRLAQVQLHAVALNKQNSKQILAYGKKSQAAIKTARAGFNTAINTLTNKVTAHNKHFEKGLEVITGVIRTNKANGKKDRALIRAQNKALNAEMNTKITKFIQQGEAQAKAIADRARSRLAKSKKALLVEISVKVEDTADKLFKAIQGNHKKLADNYLSLKAYSTVASGKLLKYVAKGKGKNLSSIGDLLTQVAALSQVKIKKAEGVGAGASSIPSVFSGKNIKVDSSLTKINGLVNEYSSVTNAARLRWPLGLGKYLLGRLEASMLKKGVLQVDKVNGKKGNFVFVNGKAIGLSTRLNDFESLAVPMRKYEAALASLTAHLAGKWKQVEGKKIKYVPPPKYDGK
jgi:hypothetical protein